MLLVEFFQSYPEAYQDRAEDNSKLEIQDTRKTRLTLKQIQKLRKMHDLRTVEHAKEKSRLKKLYGPQGDEMGGGMGMGMGF